MRNHTRHKSTTHSKQPTPQPQQPPPPQPQQPQGFESALLVGGATSAVGLFVGRIALNKAREGLRRAIDALTTPSEPMQYRIRRDFLSAAERQRWGGTGIVARDTVLGGAMLLVPGGVFYLSAPSYDLFELNFSQRAESGAASDSAVPVRMPAAAAAEDDGGVAARGPPRRPLHDAQAAADAQDDDDARREVYMLPHAYFLYQKAHCWLEEGDLGDAPDAQMRLRFSSFAADCLLHMLLNDYLYAYDHLNLHSDANLGPRIRALFEALMSNRHPSAQTGTGLFGWMRGLFGGAAAAAAVPEDSAAAAARAAEQFRACNAQKSMRILSLWYAKHGRLAARAIATMLEQHSNSNPPARGRTASRPPPPYAVFQRQRPDGPAEDQGLERIGCSFSLRPAAAQAVADAAAAAAAAAPLADDAADAAVAFNTAMPFHVFLAFEEEAAAPAAAVPAAAGASAAAGRDRGDATSKYFLDGYSNCVGRLAYRVTPP